MKKFLFFATALCAIIHVSHVRSSEYEIIMYYGIKPKDLPTKDYVIGDMAMSVATVVRELKNLFPKNKITDCLLFTAKKNLVTMKLIIGSHMVISRDLKQDSDPEYEEVEEITNRAIQEIEAVKKKYETADKPITEITSFIELKGYTK